MIDEILEVDAFDAELPRVARRILNTPLLITPSAASAVVSGLASRLGVSPLRAAAPIARRRLRDDDLYAVADGIATIAVLGETVNRGSWVGAQSDVTSYAFLQRALRQAGSDPGVVGILLDIDSPGGEAAGAVETADVVRSVSAKKPVVAFVDGVAASAAYAIAAGAPEIIVAPSATIGSIGVVYLHVDRSRAMETAGLKPTLIHAGAHKIDGNSLHPLDGPARGRIQRHIDDVYRLFVSTIGRHRPTLGESGARATDAAIYLGQRAVAAGLVDRTGTLVIARESVLRGAKSGPVRSTGKRAAMVDGPAVASAAATAAALVPVVSTPSPKMGLEARSAAIEAARDRGFDADETWIAEFAKAHRAATLVERARCRAIIECAEAKGQERLALRLACDTDWPVEQVVDALLAAPQTPAARATARASRAHFFTSVQEFDRAKSCGEIGPIDSVTFGYADRPETGKRDGQPPASP